MKEPKVSELLKRVKCLSCREKTVKGFAHKEKEGYYCPRCWAIYTELKGKEAQEVAKEVVAVPVV